jgi:hypothetical protein
MEQAPFYAFALGIVAFLVLSVFQPKRTGTIQTYFWGDGELSRRSVISLILSNSFSLNGLLYQVWLGYLIGWWALAVQAIWCSSLLLLWLRPDRLASIISEGTLHGILGERFGQPAARLAAVASTIGFAGLIGWEAVVGATLLREFGGVSTGLYVVLPILLALASAYYTRNGGLAGNGLMNQFQNAFKVVILIAAAILLWGLSEGGIGAASATKTLSESIVSLGGVAIAANFAFSFMWQAVDMSVWQSLAGLNRSDATHAREEIRKAIPTSALSVFVFPGVVGTLIGVVIAGSSTQATDMNVLNVFIAGVAEFPLIGLLLIAAFAAAMLSTIDGYSLAASQAISWDLVRSSQVKKLLAQGEYRQPSEDDRMIIGLSRAIIFFVGVGGALSMIYLVFGLGIGLFNLVYVVVVGQMSLSGPVLLTLFGKERFTVRMGWIPIAFSLLGGLASLGTGLAGVPTALTWAPVVTIAISVTCSLLLYSRFAKFETPVSAGQATQNLRTDDVTHG